MNERVRASIEWGQRVSNAEAEVFYEARSVAWYYDRLVAYRAEGNTTHAEAVAGLMEESIAKMKVLIEKRNAAFRS